MITIEALESRGYARYPDTLKRDRTGHIGLWQRRVSDERGLRYAVSLDGWIDVGAGPSLGRVTFSPRVQMRTGDAEPMSFNCEIIAGQSDTIERVEAFFERLWVAMGCRHEND